MVNCNPETVSTDYDTSDRLYFEPLTDEDVIELIRVEQRNGQLLGVIVQFGGQTPLKLAHALEAARHPDPRHLARRHRSGRGSAALPGAAAPAGPAAAGQRHGDLAGGGEAGGGADRLSAGRPPLLRAGRPGDGHPARAGGSRPLLRPADPREPGRHRQGGEDLQGLSGPARPATWRTPSRSTSTRSPTARTSTSPASCSTSRRRACTRAIPPVRCRRTRCRTALIERDRAADGRTGAGAPGRRPDERAVRGQGRRDLHPRGQSARQPHRAVRRQGDRRADRQDRRPGHGRRAAAPASRSAAGRSRTTSRSRRRCSRSPASPASTSFSARR